MAHQEELIIYDEAEIKKEFQDPLSVEEVPVNDPLAAQTDDQSEQSSVTIKQERTPEIDNEASQEMVTDSCNHENMPVNSNGPSYSVDQKQRNGGPPAQSLAEFLSSACLRSSSPSRSPLDAIALSYRVGAQDPPASSASNLCVDQDDSSAASATYDERSNLSPPHQLERPELSSPEIIYVDSDSENEHRNSEVPSPNVNSDSGVWSRNVEVSENSGVNCEPENSSTNSLTKLADARNTFNSKKVVKKGAIKPKTKNKKKQSNCSATLSSSLPILPEAEPVTKQSLTRLEEPFVTLQSQRTLPPSQQMLAQSQQTQQTLTPGQSILRMTQQNSLQNQQTWTPIHQLLALSSQILNQQQSLTSGHSSQLLSQQTVTSAQAPQLLTQHSPLALPQQFVPSVKDAAAQSRAVPPSLQKPSSAPSAKKPKLTGSSAASKTEARQTTDKPQANVKGKDITASEFISLQHKLAVHELKLRLNNTKANAKLQESELKLKLEASNQELTNKKLKHDILSAKLKFYSKLCATNKL